MKNIKTSSKNNRKVKGVITLTVLIILLSRVPKSAQRTVQYTYYNGDSIAPAVIRDERTLFDLDIQDDTDIEMELVNFATHIPIAASGEEFKIRVEVIDRGASLIMCGVGDGERVTIDTADAVGESLIIEGSYVDVEGARMAEDVHIVEKLFDGPG